MRLFWAALNVLFQFDIFVLHCIEFLLQVESSVVLKPFLNDLTFSELHAVLTSGFATVAGTVIAAYIEFGVCLQTTISYIPIQNP